MSKTETASMTATTTPIKIATTTALTIRTTRTKATEKKGDDKQTKNEFVTIVYRDHKVLKK